MSIVRLKLLLGIVLFSIWGALPAAAHEVRPAIADLTQNGRMLTLSFSLNAEALLAGVDLDGITDTNDTERSDDVDALRALEPDVLTARLTEFTPGFANSLDVQTNSGPIILTLNLAEVPPVGDISLPRDTTLEFTAELPGGAETLSVQWPASYGSLVLRQQGVDEPYTGYLEGGSGSGPIALTGGDAMGAVESFVSYIPVGFDHILPKGLDHILFVLGLFFLSTSLSTLLWQVSAFTLAHTVTLALGALGWVSVPGSIVEPLIAASIVYVAIENVLSDKLNKWRPLVIFGFGLLHGLGFASVLGDFGLPADQFIPALIGFNLGVEFGQITVIAVVFVLVWLAMRVEKGDISEKTGMISYGLAAVGFVALAVGLNTGAFSMWAGAGAPVFFGPAAGLMVLCGIAAFKLDSLDAYRRFVAVPASVAIACVGAFWFIERVFL